MNRELAESFRRVLRWLRLDSRASDFWTLELMQDRISLDRLMYLPKPECGKGSIC